MVGPTSKCSSMRPASCSKKNINGVVFELILTYLLPIECHFNHYLAKQSFELTELSRWRHHISWTSVRTIFHQRNDKNAFFTSEQPKQYKLWSCQKMCDALHYLLDNIFIRFGSKLYRQIAGIPMGTKVCSSCCRFVFVLLWEILYVVSLWQ